MRPRLVLALTLVGMLPFAGGSARAAALVSFGPAAATWGGSGATFEPISVASPPGDPRLFVVQRGGVVRIAQDGVVRPTPFLTVPGVDTAGERGLLSIAFPWDYASSGKFYVFASISGTPNSQTRILEYRVSASDPNVADPASARTVLTQDLSSATNHNGGQLAFGQDWRLYITIGDNTNRPAVQNTDSQLGKVLRIDPDDPDGAGPLTYTVPADNPFPGKPVWAMGLRNPFRASFDPAGRLIIADVGEVTWEEINIGVAGGNYGWGPRACDGASCGEGTNPIDPFYAYRHDATPGGCSIIGGVSVRDPRLTGLTGRYLFGDFCRPELRTVDLGASGPDVRQAGPGLDAVNHLIGFGEDARGCAYVLGDSTIYRVAASAGEAPACGLSTFLSTPPDPRAVPAPAASPVAATPPASDPAPTSPAPAAPVIPKNCVRDGAMSIRAAGDRRITSVRLIRGKKQKTLRLRHVGGRVELRGLPSSSKVTLSVSVRLRPGKVVRTTKRYRRCALPKAS